MNAKPVAAITTPFNWNGFSRRSRVALAVTYAIPAALCLAGHPEIKSLLAPLVGPFAARLYGHSCGAIDFAFPACLALIIYGAGAIALATKKQRGLALLPFWTWWAAWLLSALLSVLNTLS